MKYTDVLANPVVRRAEQIGFMAFGENPSKYRHFHWFMPDSQIHGDHTFSAHHFAGSQPGELDYRIDHESTNYVPRALEMLEKIAKTTPHLRPFPHEVSCPDCRDRRRCNECGKQSVNWRGHGKNSKRGSNVNIAAAKFQRQSMTLRESCSRKRASGEEFRSEGNARFSDRAQAIGKAMVENLKRNIVKDRHR